MVVYFRFLNSQPEDGVVREQLQLQSAGFPGAGGGLLLIRFRHRTRICLLQPYSEYGTTIWKFPRIRGPNRVQGVQQGPCYKDARHQFMKQILVMNEAPDPGEP